VAGDSVVNYTIEPNATAVLDALIPQLVQILLYHALLESKASEHSARMVAMKNATDKSKEVIKALTIKFNKARQAKITAEISEITAGVAAME
jgi:F-type H+-transporting ATPase subunit gamma